MKKMLFLGAMLVMALTLSAQQQMYVWQFGEKVVFEVADVDSITFGEPLPPEGWADVYIIDIDSAVTCCGIDSFTIKSPWIQDHVNTLIADTTKKYDLPTDLIIEHYIDSNNNDFFIEQYSWDRNRLYDCEGNILEEKEGYNVIELPKDAQEYKMIVEVSIGRFPNI